MFAGDTPRSARKKQRRFSGTASTFDHWVKQSSYVPWVTSLQINHYHTLGYLKHGADLPILMKRLHGSVAKLVNDLLPDRITPFWVDTGHQNYFDGCIRDVLQARRAYRYTLTQSRRHHSRPVPGNPHTRAPIDLDRAVRRAAELCAFLEAVPYARYDRRRRKESLSVAESLISSADTQRRSTTR